MIASWLEFVVLSTNEVYEKRPGAKTDQGGFVAEVLSENGGGERG
jgi:hypothetical protein